MNKLVFQTLILQVHLQVVPHLLAARMKNQVKRKTGREPERKRKVKVRKGNGKEKRQVDQQDQPKKNQEK